MKQQKQEEKYNIIDEYENADYVDSFYFATELEGY